MNVLLLILIAAVVVAARFIVLELRGIKERTGVASPVKTPRLRCVRGNHYIGNEAYTFVNFPDDGADAGEPICFRCIERSNKEANRLVDDTEKLLQGIREKEEKEQREWNSLTEVEQEARQKLFLDGREKNISEWCVKGSDGIWRRKDNGTVVEQGPVEELLKKYVFTAKGNPSSRTEKRL
jgi:hypothetical protein